MNQFSRLQRIIDRSLAETKEHTERISFNGKNFEVHILPFHAENKTDLIRIIFKDITNFLRLETELLKRNKELIIINNLSSTFISSDNLDLVLQDLMDKVLLITDFHTGWILLEEHDRLSLKIGKGISSEVTALIRDGALDGLCNNTMNLKEPLRIIEADELQKIPFLYEEGIVFLVVVPLLSEGSVTGMLFLASRVGRDIDFEFVSVMTLVGNHVTHIIGKVRLFLETKRLSITDALTGLYNTRYFYKTLDLEIARTNRYDSPFSLILFDIDNFKQMNDTYGHQAGDEVLQEIAQILRSVSRETDTIVRYGGEEFIIILPNTLEEETIFLANRIRNIVQDHQFCKNSLERVRITLSSGIASYPKNAKDAKSLLNAADSALYAAKAAGKNIVFCFEGVRQ